MPTITLLYIEDDLSYATLVKDWLSQEGFTTLLADTAAKADRLFREHHPALVMVDLDLQHPKEGLEIIRTLHRQNPGFPVIVYSAHADPETVIETMDLGVMHHISKDRSIPELIAMLRNAFRQAYRCKENWNPEYQLSDTTTFNIHTNIITINGKQEHLKKIAGRLLKQLCLHINEFVPPDELSIALWGIEKDIRELRRYIQKLRNIIETQDPQIKILNQTGGYYQLECQTWQ